MIRSKEVNMQIKSQEAAKADNMQVPIMVNDRLSASSTNDNMIKDSLQVQETNIKTRLEQRRKNNFQKCKRR